MQQTASSFDHLIGTGEKRRRNFEVECLCCFDIYDQLKLRRLFHRQIRRLGPFQYLVHITRCAVEQARDIWRAIFRDGCCAWVPTGHNAKPVSAAMNSRLLMLSPCCGRQRRKRRFQIAATMAGNGNGSHSETPDLSGRFAARVRSGTTFRATI